MPREFSTAAIRAGAATALLAATAPSHAQVNVEPVRAKLKDQGHTVQFKGSLAQRTGNTESMALGAAALAGLSGQSNLFYVTTSADYERTGEEATVSKAFAHARYNRLLLPRVWGELFGQIESDRFREMTFRGLFGTGPRFELITEEELSLVYGASYMLELTRRNDRVPVSERHRTNHRFNNYATLNYLPHPQITLSETVYYQPRFDDFSDFWLLSVFAARFAVTERLSSQIDFRVRHESRVPSDVKPTDTEFSSSLALTF